MKDASDYQVGTVRDDTAIYFGEALRLSDLNAPVAHLLEAALDYQATKSPNARATLKRTAIAFAHHVCNQAEPKGREVDG